MTSSQPIAVTGLWWYQPPALGPSIIRGTFWRSSDQAKLADTGDVSTASFVLGAWNFFPFSSSLLLIAGTEYVPAIFVVTGKAGFDTDDLTNPISSPDGVITTPSTGGRFLNFGGVSYPTSIWPGMQGVDIEYRAPVLNTPTVREGMRVSKGLWRYYSLDEGVTLLRSGTTITETRFPYQGDLDSYDAVYLGGHVYPLTSAEATILINAGYGAFLS